MGEVKGNSSVVFGVVVVEYLRFDKIGASPVKMLTRRSDFHVCSKK